MLSNSLYSDCQNCSYTKKPITFAKKLRQIVKVLTWIFFKQISKTGLFILEQAEGNSGSLRGVKKLMITLR
jgi:hypothetical protein